MNKILTFLFIFLPSLAFSSPLHLYCGKEVANKVEELNGGPRFFLIIDNMSKDSRTGSSTGKRFSLTYMVWEDVTFNWNPNTLSWTWPEMLREYDGLQTIYMNRKSMLVYPASPVDTFCVKAQSIEKVEAYAEKAIVLSMELNQV